MIILQRSVIDKYKSQFVKSWSPNAGLKLILFRIYKSDIFLFVSWSSFNFSPDMTKKKDNFRCFINVTFKIQASFIKHTASCSMINISCLNYQYFVVRSIFYQWLHKLICIMFCFVLKKCFVFFRTQIWFVEYLHDEYNIAIVS